MKSVTFEEFVAKADWFREIAQVETVIVTDQEGAPQFVVMPHPVYRQLRQGNRQALKADELSADELRDLADPAALNRYDWPNEEGTIPKRGEDA